MATSRPAPLPEIDIHLAAPLDLADLTQFVAHAGGEAHLHDFAAGVAAGEVVVARVAGTTAGFMRLGPTFFRRPFVELLIVHPDHRRRGVGTALLRHAQRQHAGTKLFTSTNVSNQPAQALFARCGFRLCGSVDDLDPGDPELVFVWPG